MSKIPQAMFRYDGYSSDCDLGLVCWRFMGGVRVYLELNNRNSRISYPWLTSSDSTVLSCNIPPPPQTPIGTQQIEGCPCPMSAEAAVGRTLVGKPGMLRVLMIIIVVVLLLLRCFRVTAWPTHALHLLTVCFMSSSRLWSQTWAQRQADKTPGWMSCA